MVEKCRRPVTEGVGIRPTTVKPMPPAVAARIPVKRGPVALAIMRLQPGPHFGHCSIINKMIADYQEVVIGLGSAQKNRELHDPFTIEERMDMIRNIYGNRIKIVPLHDLGTDGGTTDWCEYVLEKMEKLGLPPINAYFTGSSVDGAWYKNYFYNAKFNSELLPTHMIDNKTARRLFIVDRDQNFWPPASEIRMSLTLRTDEWKQWVPQVNHSLIESSYPEEFKVSL